MGRSNPSLETWLALIILISLPYMACAQDPRPIALPTANTSGGRPLMEVLKDRHSSRSFRADPLPQQMLSDLLWAAAGINRPESGHRTAPTARNWQEVDVYVFLEEGAYLYDPSSHVLVPVLRGDFRGETGGQDFVAGAPLNLVYVADHARMEGGSEADRALYSATDVGFIAQNVYLYCASAGLATVVRGTVDREALADRLGLRPEQRIILAQTIGFPSP